MIDGQNLNRHSQKECLRILWYSRFLVPWWHRHLQ